MKVGSGWQQMCGGALVGEKEMLDRPSASLSNLSISVKCINIIKECIILSSSFVVYQLNVSLTSISQSSYIKYTNHKYNIINQVDQIIYMSGVSSIYEKKKD